jgi:hypothetical protein
MQYFHLDFSPDIRADNYTRRLDNWFLRERKRRQEGILRPIQDLYLHCVICLLDILRCSFMFYSWPVEANFNFVISA